MHWAKFDVNNELENKLSASHMQKSEEYKLLIDCMYKIEQGMLSNDYATQV